MGNPIIFTTKIAVRYQETDQMGVAHHSVYPVWFEVSRTEFIRAFGMPYGRMESEGLYLPLIEMACRFKSYARYEDELLIRARIAELTKTRLRFRYEASKDGREIADGETAHIFANNKLKPVNLLKHNADLYRLFMKIYGQDVV